MTSLRPFHGRSELLRSVCHAVLTAIVLLLPAAASAADEFPFDQELILDAKRMGNSKRLPMLTVEPGGKAVIDLWCKTVPARVDVAGSTIKIEVPPLPDEMPSMMGPGQCTPDRMQADQDLIAAFAQVTDWRAQGQAIVLNGPTVLRFNPSSH